jgi:hypothetical protein
MPSFPAAVPGPAHNDLTPPLPDTFEPIGDRRWLTVRHTDALRNIDPIDDEFGTGPPGSDGAQSGGCGWLLPRRACAR